MYQRAAITIAYDLDGTLISCAERQVEVAKHALRKCSVKTLNGELFWNLKRGGANTEEALSLVGLDEGHAREAACLWRDAIEYPRWLQDDRLLEDTIRILRETRRRNRQVLVITARKNTTLVRWQICKLGIHECIDDLIVINPSEVIQGKAKVLRHRKVDGYIGDTELDWEAARLAGAAFVAVATGQRAPDYLLSKGVTPVCGTLAEAYQTLETMLARRSVR